MCILFVPLMQLVNGTEFLNITFLSALFGAAAVPVSETVIAPLTSIYASLWSHKLGLNIEVLSLI